MADGAILIVFVLATELSDPTTSAMRRAATEVLGTEASVRLEPVDAQPTDAEALSRSDDVDGLVELSWSDAHQTANLHCYLARQARWVDRTINFAGDDADTERGRLLGFAMASMLLKAPAAVHPDPIPEPAIAPVAPRRPEILPLVDRPPPRLLASPGRFFEFAGMASAGIAGSGTGVGAALGLRLEFAPRFWARGGVSGRVGDIDEAQATSRLLTFGVGVAWQPLEATAVGQFGLGLRLDALGGWLQVSHLSSDDARPDRQSRWLFGGDALLEASLGISNVAALYLSSGVEAFAGETDLYTHGELSATIPMTRIMGELGVRTRF